MRRVLFRILLFCVWSFGLESAARAQTLVTDLTDHLVRITTEFHGADIVLFGAAPEGGDVVVTVSGPPRDIIVRRRHRVAGIWLNGHGVTFADVPGFYAVFSSRPLGRLLSPSAQAFEHVGTDQIRLKPIDAASGDNVAVYRQALVEALQRQGLYAPTIGEVKFLGGKLFRTTVTFPSDTPVGDYTVETMLVSNNMVVAWDRTPFAVEKAGLPAEINDFSRDHGLTYGILAVCAAALTGWVSALLFRKG